MKKRVYRRALRIAAQYFAREGYCIYGETHKNRVCGVIRAAHGGVINNGDAACERCIREFFQRKATKELRQEGRL